MIIVAMLSGHKCSHVMCEIDETNQFPTEDLRLMVHKVNSWP